MPCASRNSTSSAGRDAHDHQREDEHLLAAESIAEMTEDGAAERAGDEPDAERGEREHGPEERAGLGEEQLREHQRSGGAVDEEVVELDGGADQAGGGHPADRRRGDGIWAGTGGHRQLLLEK
jgi:hypothetical protein